MSDETATGSSGSSDGRGHHGGSSREQSPLQTRAAFLKNRSWESVISLNRGACERGRAQHGQNSEGYRSVEAAWKQKQSEILTLQETLDFLKSCHRGAPFLFFNGNTFADIARSIADLISAIAHYVAGVLDGESMRATIDSLWQSASFQPGDKVKTLKGSLHGVIVEILDDGRIKWRAETGSLFVGLPESLVLAG
jgi:hypothetical protein